MGPEDLRAALEYAREWNTNARNCHAAQALLRAILRRHKPAALLAVPGARCLHTHASTRSFPSPLSLLRPPPSLSL